MFCYKITSLLLSCLLLSILSFAQIRQYRFDRFSYEQGLTFGQVYALATDTFGFVWVGTVGGLFKYDGYQFHAYYYDLNNPKSLSNPRVFTLLNDSKGRLWVGTGNGLNLYNRANDNFKHFFPKENLPDPLVSNHIESLFEDSNGRIWVGTLTGLLLFNPNNGTFIHFKEEVKGGDKFALPIVKGITEDNNHRIWAIAQYGVLQVNPDQGTVNWIEPKSSLHNNERQLTYTKIYTDELGTIWVGSQEGLYQWLPDKKELFTYPLPDSLKKINSSTFICKSENLWIGTYTDGLIKLNLCTNELTQFKHLPQNPLTIIDSDTRSFTFDKTGNLWIGSLTGVNKLNINHTNFPFYQISPEGTPNQNFIYFVYEDSKKNIWIKNKIPDLLISKRLGDIPKKMEDIAGINSFANIKYSQGDSVWIYQPQKGLLIYSLKKKDIQWLDYGDTLKSVNLLTINPDISETQFQWLNTNEGLCKLNKKNGKREWYFPKNDLPWLESNHVVRVLQISKDTLIVLLDSNGVGALACFDKKTKNFIDIETAFHLKHDVPKGNMRQIVMTLEGDIWIASINGLIQFSPLKHEFKVFTTETGLIEDDIMAVNYDSKGYIWFSSEHYLYRYDPESKVIWHFDLAKEIHGFMSGMAIRDSNSRLIFTGSNGLIAFYPDSVRLDPLPPRVVLTNFRIRNQSINLGSAPELVKLISVDYNDNVLQFEFAGLHFIDAHNNQYKYKLEGFDKDWIVTGTQHQVTYTNLFPKTYIFRVRAANSDGVWGGEKEELTIILKITPPWYWAWYTKILYTLLLLAAIYYFYRFQLNRRLALERAELAQQRARQLQELDTAKTNLYMNITHEFRTPLTLILGMADKIEQAPRQWLKEGVDMIKRNGQNLLRLVNQMLDLSKLEGGSLPVHLIQGDIVAYLHTLLELFHSYAESKNIHLSFESEHEHFVMDYDPDKIKDIVSNLLSNALKFTSAGGQIKLAVGGGQLVGDKNIFILVEDTGIGIPAEKLPHIFDRFYQADDSATRHGEGTGIGLALTKELVKLLGGDIKVKSGVNEGSIFTVYLPIHHNAPLQEAQPVLEPATAERSEVVQLLKNQSLTSLPLALIVEDNADVIRYLSSCLEDQYRIEVAYNGQAGIDKALEIVPDVIISDVMMPEKDGFELCRTLKEDMRSSHIPIILLTARADMDARLEGLEGGADAYLTKPFNEQELEVSLRKSLELRERLRARYAQESPVIPQPEKIFSKEDAFIKTLHDVLEANYSDEEFIIPQLANKMGMSHAQLGRKMHALLGTSPQLYLRHFRLQKAYHLLKHTDLSIKEIAFETGFDNPAYFSNIFLEEFQQRPSDLRE